MVGESQEAVGVGGGSGPSSNKMPTLEEYGTNLTTQASEVRRPPEGLLVLSSGWNLEYGTYLTMQTSDVLLVA